MAVSKPMTAKLNAQITAELAAAHRYLAMSCQFDQSGLKVLSNRFFEQHKEEWEHALKIVKYMLEVGAAVSLDSIPKPAKDLKSPEAIVSAALEGEREVTRMIHELVALADSEKDYPTRSFLQWFVDEQVEEESTMTDLLNLIKLAGGNMLLVESRLLSLMASKS